ncbi:MAG: FliH/SctL family protein [Phycisphaerae bacterium]|jgi:flagellar assembly protein FliH|nr:FliH/SctL family protein [Phycisphaerae bacterium]
MTQIIKKAKRLPDGGQSVMKLADIATQANEIILDARKAAAVIRTEARAKIETAREQARRQGYSEGFAEGQVHGMRDGERTAGDQARARIGDQSKQLLDLAGSILDKLGECGEGPYQLAADEVLEFAIDLSTKIVGQLARTDPSVARGNLMKAMKLAGADGEMIVAVNPVQLQELSRDFAEFVEVIDASGRARLVGDRKVAPGGVKITTARGVIDATVETQLDKVVSALSAGGLVRPPETPGKSNIAPQLRILDDDVSV